MNKWHEIVGGYSYDTGRANPNDVSAMGRRSANHHGAMLRDAVERAICRFYQVSSLQDANADKILDAGNHEYHEGIPFQIIQLQGNAFVVQDLKTKREIAVAGQFQVERDELDHSTIEDSITRIHAYMRISQSYQTFDGVK